MPMVVPGIVLISMVMAFYEAGSLYPEKGVTGHAQAILVCAFALPLCVQIGYIVIVCRCLKFDPVYLKQIRTNRKTTLSLLGVSMTLNFRIVKLSYTNVSDRLNLHSLREEDNNFNANSGVWSMRRINMLLSTLMVPSDIALCFIAISAFQ